MNDGNRQRGESANTKDEGREGRWTRGREGEAKGRARGEGTGARVANTLKSASSLLSELMTSTVSCSLRFLAAAGAAAADAFVGESAKNLDCTTAPPLCAAGDAAAARGRLLGDSSTWDAPASPRFEPACTPKFPSVHPHRPVPTQDAIHTYGRNDSRSRSLADGRVPARPGTADGCALSPDPRRIPAAAASAPTATPSIPAACCPCCPWSPRPLPSSETLRARALRRRLPQPRPLCPPSRRLRPLWPRAFSFRPCPPPRARSLSAHAAHAGKVVRAPSNEGRRKRCRAAPQVARAARAWARAYPMKKERMSLMVACAALPLPPRALRSPPNPNPSRAIDGLCLPPKKKKVIKEKRDKKEPRTGPVLCKGLSACCVTPPSASPSW